MILIVDLSCSNWCIALSEHQNVMVGPWVFCVLPLLEATNLIFFCRIGRRRKRSYGNQWKDAWFDMVGYLFCVFCPWAQSWAINHDGTIDTSNMFVKSNHWQSLEAQHFWMRIASFVTIHHPSTAACSTLRGPPVSHIWYGVNWFWKAPAKGYMMHDACMSRACHTW